MPTLRFLASSSMLCLLLAAPGCGRVHVGTQDGGSGADGGIPHDGWDLPLQCGRAVCDQGLVCCNASCGICAAPDQGCIAIACVDGCATNADCGPSEYCLLAGACPSTCALPEGCPTLPQDGVCTPRSELCPEIFSPACGCDGVTYENRCSAAAAGVNVVHDGECGSGGTCEAQDAQGQGACDAFFGYAWTGSSCAGISGCSCVGTDCGVYGVDDEAQCISDHAACAPCDAMDARGEGSCEAFFGYAWDGAGCPGISGCSCVGADCAGTYDSPESCLEAFSTCWEAPGCASNADCATFENCLYPTGSCGNGGSLGTCTRVPPPIGCGADAPVVCGCDGVTHTCEISAQVAGTSVRHVGACDPSCAAMDAAGVGDCAAWFGVTWNGTACVGVGGCDCEGADCDRLYESEEQCLAAHPDC